MHTNDNTNEIESKTIHEDWLQRRWRPLIAGMYLIVCLCDFVIFPVLWGILQAMAGGTVETQWIPLTLSGAGMFHISIGAILGVAAYGRTQEKLAGVATDGINSTLSTPSPISPKMQQESYYRQPDKKPISNPPIVRPKVRAPDDI